MKSISRINKLVLKSRTLRIFEHLSSSNKPSYSLYQNQVKMGLPLKDIIKKLQGIAPLNLAESWDNVGLLVEPNSNSLVKSVLLTIDLTEEVVDEAVKIGSQLIISYHPNIFKPLKTITQSTWKERIIVKCIKNDIAVFSPHTTWDAMENGVNDWLAFGFNLQSFKPILPNTENPNEGAGRLVSLQQPTALKLIIETVKRHIGLPHLRLGLAKDKTLDTPINTIALCAGSGASVLNGIEADLYLTGEMLHHDVLDATQKGISVILCNHSDSERGYLQVFKTLLKDDELSIFISNVDKDCLTTV